MEDQYFSVSVNRESFLRLICSESITVTLLGITGQSTKKSTNTVSVL
jgi:hypothetical protein